MRPRVACCDPPARSDLPGDDQAKYRGFKASDVEHSGLVAATIGSLPALRSHALPIATSLRGGEALRCSRTLEVVSIEAGGTISLALPKHRIELEKRHGWIGVSDLPQIPLI